jgi:phage-related protein
MTTPAITKAVTTKYITLEVTGAKITVEEGSYTREGNKVTVPSLNSTFEVAAPGKKGAYERFKNHHLVQSLKDGEPVDHEMFPPHKKSEALKLRDQLRKEGHKRVVVCHPAKESFE